MTNNILVPKDEAEKVEVLMKEYLNEWIPGAKLTKLERLGLEIATRGVFLFETFRGETDESKT